jgi:hypothetical protein
VIEQNIAIAMHDGVAARCADALGERNQETGRCFWRLFITAPAQDSRRHVMLLRIEVATDDNARIRFRVE